MNKLIFLILLFINRSSSQQISVPLQYLQCNGGDSPQPAPDIRGIPGKRGPKGEQGEVGFADERVLEMINRTLEEFRLQINQLQRENEVLHTEYEQLISENEALKKNFTKTDAELQSLVDEFEILKTNITTKTDAELQALMACRVPLISNLQAPTPGFYANHDLDNEVNFTCKSTHTPRSSDVLKRQCNNGAWVPSFNSSNIVCQQKCIVPTLKNGSSKPSVGEQVNHSEQINFTCDQNFSSPDIMVRTCVQGTFAPTITPDSDPKCYSDCTVPMLANLKTPASGSKVKHSSVISTYACNVDYKIRSGQAVNRTCTDGVWSPIFDRTGTFCEQIPRTTWCAVERSHLRISCTANNVIKIHSASYGIRDGNVCDGRPVPRSCSYQVTSTVRRKCGDKTSCSVQASNGNFGDSCYGKRKYLTATWSCQ